jgi:hypothetical protein
MESRAAYPLRDLHGVTSAIDRGSRMIGIAPMYKFSKL